MASSEGSKMRRRDNTTLFIEWSIPDHWDEEHRGLMRGKVIQRVVEALEDYLPNTTIQEM